MRILYRGMLYFIFLWVFVVWTLVGFFFWIPFLIRMISLTSAIMIFIAISSSITTSRSDLMRKLQKAIDFYLDGFTSIRDTLTNVESAHGSSVDRRQEVNINWAEVIIQSIFALLFWLISLSIVLQDFTVFIVIQNLLNAVGYAVNNTFNSFISFMSWLLPIMGLAIVGFIIIFMVLCIVGWILNKY